MKLILSKSPILAVVVVAGLAAGTALVAGYADRPQHGVQVAAHDCDNCPKAGTDACCKVQGACQNPQQCAGGCALKTAGEAKPAATSPHAQVQADASVMSADTPQAGCCPASGGMSPVGCCPGSAGTDEAVKPCGAGGCTLAQ